MAMSSKPPMTPETATPLVSIGIPTYARPNGLRRTLDLITRQTYKNLEIIVSDNASPGDATAMVVQEFAARDNRIRSFRQSENIGVINNFRFVLAQSVGEYFMWAADDDERDVRFVEFCLSEIGDSGSI